MDLPNDLYSFFAQDQWRLRTNLTLNLGVRYDRETGFSKITDVPDDSNNFQPRLGVVWDPFNDGRTAVRGGYGHYVDQSFLNIQLNVASAKGAVETVIVNPGLSGSVFARHDAQRRRRASPTITPNPHTPETRTASVGVKREIVAGLRGVGRRRLRARLQPVRVAGSQLSGSGDGPFVPTRRWGASPSMPTTATRGTRRCSSASEGATWHGS